MALTVRQRGQLFLPNRKDQVDDVVATVWFDQDEERGSWGGIVEPEMAASLLRAEVVAGRTRYHLRLEDGRAGAVRLHLSEFEADGVRPLAFEGLGTLVRSSLG